jgi:hypothetical protein
MIDREWLVAMYRFVGALLLTKGLSLANADVKGPLERKSLGGRWLWPC